MEPVAPLTVDSLSIWLQNKQLFEQFDDNKLLSLQNEIVNTVFGGFKSLLELLLRGNNNIMTVSQHHKFHQLLSNNYDQDIFNTYRDKVKQSDNSNNNDNTSSTHLLDLPDDCLSYTMKYLTPHERYTIQQCCRLLTIVTRQESSVNDIEKDLPLMRMVPYKRNMLQGFISDDEKEIMQSFDIYLKYKELIRRTGDIEHYSKPLHEKFKKLLVQHKSNQTVMAIIAGLEHDLLSFGFLPLAADILKTLVNNARDAIKTDEKNEIDGTPFKDIMYAISCAVDWSNDVPTCDGLIPALYDAIPAFGLFKYKENWHQEDVFSSGCEIFYEILKYSYDSHRKILVETGLIDKLFIIANAMDPDEFYSCDVYKVLQYYLMKATSEEVDEFLKHEFMNKLLNKNDIFIKHGAQNCILKLLKCTNHSQRMVVVDKLIVCRDSLSTTFCEQIVKVLETMNDIEAKNKFGSRNRRRSSVGAESVGSSVSYDRRSSLLAPNIFGDDKDSSDDSESSD